MKRRLFDVDKSEKLKEVYSINNIFLLDMKVSVLN